MSGKKEKALREALFKTSNRFLDSKAKKGLIVYKYKNDHKSYTQVLTDKLQVQYRKIKKVLRGE